MFWQADNDSVDPNKSLINAVAKVYAADTINASVNSVTETSAKVSWNKPELDGSITYKVVLDGEVVAENITSQEYVLTNLDKAKQYQVQVIATASNGNTLATREDSLVFETLGAIVEDVQDPVDDQDQSDDQNQEDQADDQNQQDQSNEDDQQTEDQEPTTNGSWTTDGVYNKGDTVIIDGKTYEAQWWTQGENPSDSGQWGVWRQLGVDPNQNGDNNADTGTDNPSDNQDTPVVNQAWTAQKIYNTGDKVVVNGITYTAKWWSQGQNPESSSAWSKPYVAGSQWKISDSYTSGQVVSYQGEKYQAKWWTKGNSPANSGVWKKYKTYFETLPVIKTYL